MTQLTDYETGCLFGTLSVDQFNNLPKALKDKLLLKETE